MITFKTLQKFFSFDEQPDAPRFDPLHVGAVVVVSLLVLTVLFWLLWTLVVFGGGIQAKILPILSVVFTPKTLADYGYAGYPYQMGVFEGWVANVTALFFCFLLAFAVRYVFQADKK